jgi:hypothetical protein
MKATVRIKQIEFLARIFASTSCYHDLISFLKTEGVVTETELKDRIRDTAQRLDVVQSILASERDNLQMVTYEWSRLPVETMRLYIVTSNNTWEVNHEEP